MYQEDGIQENKKISYENKNMGKQRKLMRRVSVIMHLVVQSKNGNVRKVKRFGEWETPMDFKIILILFNIHKIRDRQKYYSTVKTNDPNERICGEEQNNDMFIHGIWQ